MSETFTKSDLTEEFLRDVVLIEIFPSSGQFGVGYVRLITADSNDYLANFNDLRLRGWELDKLHPMFRREENYEGSRRPYVAEITGWTYIERERVLVRDEFYEAFVTVYQEEVQKPENCVRCVDIANIVRRTLGIEENVE